MKKALEAFNMVSPFQLEQRLKSIRQGLQNQMDFMKGIPRNTYSFSYNQGMYNGMEFALCVLEDRNVEYMNSNGEIDEK